MAKAPKKALPDEDEAQSRRFMEAARELEAAGELNLTAGEDALNRLVSQTSKAPHEKAKGDPIT
jgi:hypothetical protein